MTSFGANITEETGFNQTFMVISTLSDTHYTNPLQHKPTYLKIILNLINEDFF